jgi:hypothetical protein
MNTSTCSSSSSSSTSCSSSSSLIAPSSSLVQVCAPTEVVSPLHVLFNPQIEAVPRQQNYEKQCSKRDQYHGQKKELNGEEKSTVSKQKDKADVKAQAKNNAATSATSSTSSSSSTPPTTTTTTTTTSSSSSASLSYYCRICSVNSHTPTAHATHVRGRAHQNAVKIYQRGLEAGVHFSYQRMRDIMNQYPSASFTAADEFYVEHGIEPHHPDDQWSFRIGTEEYAQAMFKTIRKWDKLHEVELLTGSSGCVSI